MAHSTLVSVLFFTLFSMVILAQLDEHHDHDHEAHSDEHFDIFSTDDHHHEQHESDNIITAIGVTTFAGCASMLGALSIFCVKKEQIAVMPASLAFSAGVTIYLSFVNLIPECVEQFHHSIGEESEFESMADVYALLCIIAGVLLTLAMETISHKFGAHTHTTGTPPITANVSIDITSVTSAEAFTPKTADDTHVTEAFTPNTTEQFPFPNHSHTKPETANYSRVSYSVAFALILHHFPEGIATFVSLYHDLEFGVLVAFALALHDIPSGVCISVPTYIATGSKCKPFALCFIAAITYPIGGLIGWFIIVTLTEFVIDIFIATLFGVISGIMLYVSFVELLPTAIIAAKKHNKGRNSDVNVYAISISLLFIGFLVMAVSNILLNAMGGHSH